MLRTALSGLVAATLLGTPATAAVAAAPDPTGPALQHQIDAVHAAGLPGAFAEVHDGRRTWTPTSGVADVETGEPVRDGMRHRVGSITKTFVATTVLQLVGERRIALDAPVGRYLPGVVPGDLGRQVTVRMLLNHTSGIGDYDTALVKEYDDIIAVGETVYRPRQLAAIGLAEPVTNAPGAGWAYSNTNYVLAGLIIEKVTGRPYAAEVTRRILRPLGLHDSYFPGREPWIRGPHMAAYVPWIDGELRDFQVYGMTWAWAAGELISTAHDLNVFYRALLTGRLLSPQLMAEMQTTVPEAGYGLGIYVVDAPCGRFWGHDGGTIGHKTISWHSADGRRQVSYAQNLSFYAAPGEPNPIDEARGTFLLTALCGPEQGEPSPSTTRSRGGAPVPPTPDLYRSL